MAAAPLPPQPPAALPGLPPPPVPGVDQPTALAAPVAVDSVSPVPVEPQGIRAQVPAAVIERLLLGTPFFAGAEPGELSPALPMLLPFECPAGGVVLGAGTNPGCMGILVSGSANIVVGAPGEDGTAIETLQSPDLFGEAGALTGGPNPYTVVAAQACRVIWATPEAVAALFTHSPRFFAAVSRRLATRTAALCAQWPSAASVILLADAPEEAPVGAAPPPAPSVLAGDASLPPPPVIAGLVIPDKPAVEADEFKPKVIRFVELAEFDISPAALALLPAKLLRQHRVLPIRLKDKVLTLGMVAPKNVAVLAELSRVLPSVELDVVAISMDDFASALVRLKLDESRDRSGRDAMKVPTINPDSLIFESPETERENAAAAPKLVGDDVIRYVNRFMAAAIEREASDVHLEYFGGGIRVRFRVNGTLQDWTETIGQQYVRGVVARIKVLGGLDITERRRPQDGRIGLKVGKREMDLRVSCLPSSRGEKLVMRVLDSSGGARPLTQLFTDQRVLNMARKTLNRPYGGIIVAGATGAGKTSTLYAMLHERRVTRPDTHIVMVEDPIEYRLDGVTQVQVDAGADLTFAKVLRSTLRQDPDVIVVGEMRDTETARIGLEAAMTGHVLLTSIHANGAISALQRLEQLGCGRPLIAQSVSLVIVQRLVRRLCSACRVTEEAPAALYESLVARKVLEPGARPKLPRPIGCETCHKTGYVGRVAVFESLQLSDDTRTMLAAGVPLPEIEHASLAQGVMVPFHQYAAGLLKEGLVSGNEALLVVAE